MPCGNSLFGDVPSKSFTMTVCEILGYKSCWSLMANFTNGHCLKYRILDCLRNGGDSSFLWVKMSFFNFRNTGGRSGEMEISLPSRFFAFCSHRFLWDKSVKRIRIPASGSWLRRWQALMRVLPALGTFKVSFASLIQDARVSSSLSFAAPATPLIIRAHFRRWTSNSNWRIARAVVMEAMWVVIEGRASVITVSTRLSDACVVKFGLDITRIPLRTDGRWKAYL